MNYFFLQKVYKNYVKNSAKSKNEKKMRTTITTANIKKHRNNFFLLLFLNVFDTVIKCHYKKIMVNIFKKKNDY